jgi:hypothetical protein
MVREELKSFDEKAPSGWEGTVKALKKHGDEVDNPWALAHWMKEKGYKSHKESVNESAVSFWQDMFRPGPIPKGYITQLIKKKGELPSKSHIKKIYKDNGNPSSSELAKSWKDLTKEKYVRAASGMWRWNADFTGWESVNEMPNFDRGTSGLPKGWIEDYNKIIKKLSKGKGWGALSRSDKQKVWAALGKKYVESVNESSYTQRSILDFIKANKAAVESDSANIPRIKVFGPKQDSKYLNISLAGLAKIAKIVKNESVNEAKAKAGDYVKVITGEVGQINKVRGTLAWIKLASSSKSFWPSDIRKLKPAGKEKGKNLWTEGFGGELKGKDREKFEKARKENAEQLGYKLTGKGDIREAIKFSKEEMTQLHQNGKLEKDGYTYVYKEK